VAAPEKRARRQNALIVFEDESGVSLLPSVRATWAPRGHTPVLKHRFNWKRLSLAGALAYEPDGSDAHLVFQLRPGAYNDETLIEFLTELNELEQRRPVVLIWDGLPSHRSGRMPTTSTRSNWSGAISRPRSSANLCSDTIHEVADIAEGGLNRIGTDASLCFDFLRHCGLRL
jgi:hypothetical protein